MTAGPPRSDDPTPVRVLIIDDDVVLAEALSLVLGREPDLQVVGLAHTGAEGVALAEHERPEVVLMDFHLPDMTGAAATQAVCDRLSGAAVVMLTIDTRDETLLAALEAGAAGFLVKSQGVRRVVDIVRRAAARETLVSPDTMARLLGALREQRRRAAERAQTTEQLTGRELEILTLMAQGLDTKALAARLMVSTTTIRTHVQSILAKLGVHSRLEAVARATDLGILPR